MPARPEDEPFLYLWDGDAPGSEGQTATEQVQVRYPGYREGWQGDAAGERIVSQIHRPSITPFLPARFSLVDPAAAVILIPGGGHQANCFDLEGTFIGRWLAERGVAAFVLKYRLARSFGDDAPESPYELIHSVLDTERAVRMVRSRAAELHVDPKRIGVAGFSAGGYAAAHASMRSVAGAPNSSDPIDRFTSRPDFQVLVYPHLLDVAPKADSPPALLICAQNDKAGGSNEEALAIGRALGGTGPNCGELGETVARLYLRFNEVGASAELHMFARGGHGFGLRPLKHGAEHRWPERMLEWLETVCPPAHLQRRAGAGLQDSFATHGRL